MVYLLEFEIQFDSFKKKEIEIVNQRCQFAEFLWLDLQHSQKIYPGHFGWFQRSGCFFPKKSDKKVIPSGNLT
jgi:hypothetical protein